MHFQTGDNDTLSIDMTSMSLISQYEFMLQGVQNCNPKFENIQILKLQLKFI